jgi:hypothetical protein
MIRGKPKTEPAKLRFPEGTLVELQNGAIYEVIQSVCDRVFSSIEATFAVVYTHNLPHDEFEDDEYDRVFRYKDLTHAYNILPPIVRILHGSHTR